MLDEKGFNKLNPNNQFNRRRERKRGFFVEKSTHVQSSTHNTIILLHSHFLSNSFKIFFLDKYKMVHFQYYVCCYLFYSLCFLQGRIIIIIFFYCVYIHLNTLYNQQFFTHTSQILLQLLACVHDEHVTYASNNQDLVPPVVYEDPSPLLTIEQSVIVHNFETQVRYYKMFVVNVGKIALSLIATILMKFSGIQIRQKA